MITFSERLEYIARVKKKSQASIGRHLNKHRNEVNRWFRKGVIPRPETIQDLADFLECDYDWLASGTGDPHPQQRPEITKPIGDAGLKEPSSHVVKLYQIPVLGNVPAGIPNTLEEYVEEYISVPDVPPDCYALKVHGESMEPGIKHGDYVFFVIDKEPQSGDVVVVNDEFGDSMIKRYKVKGDEQRLVSDNPAYETYIPNSHYRIMGVVVDGMRKLKI